jgi:hypothetical protein
MATNPGTVVVTQATASPLSTLDGSPTLPVTANPLFSPTPTSLIMSTIATQQTATANASYLTSTAMARSYSPTPTSLGAEKITPIASSDAASLSLPLMTTPGSEFSEAMIITPTTTFSPTPVQALVDVQKRPEAKTRDNQVWILMGTGVLILLFLFPILYREWKKLRQPVNNSQN